VHALYNSRKSFRVHTHTQTHTNTHTHTHTNTHTPARPHSITKGGKSMTDLKRTFNMDKSLNTSVMAGAGRQ